MCEHPEFVFSEKSMQSPHFQDGAKTVSPPFRDQKIPRVKAASTLIGVTIHIALEYEQTACALECVTP